MAGITRFALIRIASGLLTILIIVTFVFIMMRVVSDPVAALMGDEPTLAQIESIRARLGLNLPIYQQYFNFIVNSLQGDFGNSYRNNQPALELVLYRLPATVELALLAFAMAAIVAIPVGVISAVRPGSLVDSVSRIFAVLGQSLPVFWLAILLIMLFSVHLRWFPTGGRGGIEHLVLPALALSMYSVPLTMRLTRSAVLEVLRKDYIRTARAKGLSESAVIVKHGLRNAMIPVITVMTLRVGAVMSGAIVLEEVFAYPGLGRLGVQALRTADFPVIQAFILFVAAITIVINLLADILYSLVDPRVKLN